MTLREHALFETGDPDAPAAIIDNAGQVALGMCRTCGAAEIELDQVPHCPGRRLKAWDVRYPTVISPKHPCAVCGSYEQGPVIHDRLWSKACATAHTRSCLCPKCLEKALGRRLGLGDLKRHGDWEVYGKSFFHLEGNREWVEAFCRAEIAKVQLAGHLAPYRKPAEGGEA